jgi:hypothetical protein
VENLERLVKRRPVLPAFQATDQVAFHPSEVGAAELVTGQEGEPITHPSTL